VLIYIHKEEALEDVERAIRPNITFLWTTSCVFSMRSSKSACARDDLFPARPVCS